MVTVVPALPALRPGHRGHPGGVPGAAGRRVRDLVLVDLPEIPLPDWVAGVRLLGPMTLESVLAGLYDGMRLATIVICVGAANSLANPSGC